LCGVIEAFFKKIGERPILAALEKQARKEV
jgi:hypothetical protein